MLHIPTVDLNLQDSSQCGYIKFNSNEADTQNVSILLYVFLSVSLCDLHTVVISILLLFST